MSEEPQEPLTQGAAASAVRGEGAASEATPGEAVAPPPLSKRAEAAAKKAARAAAKKEPESPPEIPADAYVVSLPTFEGPLDLLLHVIQKHELDILDIPVSFVTEKYLQYLDVMRSLTIDLASEYLVMAATLIHIKSKMLLPQLPGGQDDVGEEIEEDPRGELVRRLLDYQKYKAAAEDLHDRDTLGHKVFPRGSGELVEPGPAPFQPFGVFNLFDALEKVLARTNQKIEHNVVFDRISITDRIVELTQKMKTRRQMLFEELFDADRSTFEVVITFLAVLEMCKLKLMRVYQADVLASIHVELLMVDDVADGDELDFATSGGSSLASGPLPPPPGPASAPPEALADAAPAEPDPAVEEPVAEAFAEPEPVATEPEPEAEPEAEAEPEPEPAAEPESEPAPASLADPGPTAAVMPVEPLAAAAAPLDEDAAFAAEFAALLAEEEAERQAALAAARETDDGDSKPEPAITVDD